MILSLRVRRVVGMGGEGWNPWAALRARDHITFKLKPLPDDLGAVYWPRPQGTLIVIDPGLSQVERRAALAHELIHDERGGGACEGVCPEHWWPVVARAESAVEDEVARRLVPLGQLATLMATLADMGHDPDLWEIAEEFGVPEHVAGRALTLLGREGWAAA